MRALKLALLASTALLAYASPSHEDASSIGAVASNSALRALARGQYDTVMRKGFANSRDGGIALFAWNPASTCTDDGGSCINSAVGGTGRWEIVPGFIVTPAVFGADNTGVADSTVALNAHATWIQSTRPGGVLDCGGLSKTYKIGTNAVANIPWFTLTHPIYWRDCNFSVANGLATTDVFFIQPATSTGDAIGWGFDRVVFNGTLNAAVFRHLFNFSDAGDTNRTIKGLVMRSVINNAPSANRNGNDINTQIIPASNIGLITTSVLGPGLALYEPIVMKNVGDNVTLLQPIVSTDGVDINTKIGIDISNSSAGAGQLNIIDPNVTMYGGIRLQNTYGASINGGVVEGGTTTWAPGQFTGSIAATTLTVTAAASGSCPIAGDTITSSANSDVTAGTYIQARLTGNECQFPSTYQVSVSQTRASETMGTNGPMVRLEGAINTKISKLQLQCAPCSLSNPIGLFADGGTRNTNAEIVLSSPATNMNATRYIFDGASAASSRSTILGTSNFGAQSTVASLPTCNAAFKGNVQTVTDALAPAYNTTVAPGGAIIVPVICDGTNWKAH